MFPLEARFTGEGGWPVENKKARELLTVGEVYTVARLEVGRWSSALYLVDFPDEQFNAVMFDGVGHAFPGEDDDAEPPAGERPLAEMTRAERIEWMERYPAMKPEDVPGSWITVAGDNYSMHGHGLLRNILAGVAPLIAEAERERIRQQSPVCPPVVPPNVLCMACFRPLCRSCGACECPDSSQSLCGPAYCPRCSSQAPNACTCLESCGHADCAGKKAPDG